MVTKCTVFTTFLLFCSLLSAQVSDSDLEKIHRVGMKNLNQSDQLLKELGVKPDRVGLLLYTYDPEKAKLWLNARLEQTGDLNYLYELAFTVYRLGELDTAKDAVNYLLEREPELKKRTLARTLYLSGNIELRKEQFEDAEFFFERSIATYEKEQLYGGVRLNLLKLFEIALKEKRYVDAENLLDKAREYNELNVAMGYKGASEGSWFEHNSYLHYYRGDYRSALELVEAGIYEYDKNDKIVQRDFLRAQKSIYLYLNGQPRDSFELAKSLNATLKQCSSDGLALTHMILSILFKCASDDQYLQFEKSFLDWASPSNKMFLEYYSYLQSLDCPDWR